MEKAKKKEALSLEERLEQILVSVDEQPYEVPENWCWIHLLEAFDNLTDSKKKLATKEYLEEGLYPVVDQGQAFIGGYTDADGMLYEGGLPVVVFGDHTRCMKYVEFPFVQGADGVKVLRPKSFWDSKAFYYAFKSVEIPNLGYRRHYPLFKDFCIPVPPLAEQKRIVEQIESLFAKLDEAKDELQEVLDSYEARRTSILRKAVTGELTKEWRANAGINKEEWKTIALGKCGTWFGGGTPTTSKKEYWDGGTIPWITSKDMKEKCIEDSLLHITQAGVDNSSANYSDKPAVLFVMRSGILRRVFPVCMVKVPFTVNQDLKAVIPEKVQQEYLYWVCTAYEKDIRDNCMKSGTTVESIEAKKLQNYEIPLPTEAEQAEIVRIIETFTTKEEAVKCSTEDVIDKIELMKKSILSKAFRGELGTNNPDENSSVELLMQILEEVKR